MTPAIGYAPDPLKDARHRSARAGRECVDWLAWLELEGKAERTLDDYERTVAVLINAHPEKEFAEFTDGDVFRVLSGYPAKSRRTRRAHLNSFFRWGLRTRRITENPLEYVPQQRASGQRVVEVFTEAEITALTSLPSPDGHLFTLLFDTGLRKAEARNLQLRHVSVAQRQLVVFKGKGDKDRLVPLTARALQAVADMEILEGLSPIDHLWYTRPGGGSVVRRDRPAGNGAWHRWYVACLDRADVVYVPRSDTHEGIHNPHVTRHTFATRYLRAGGRLERLSKIMGHASIQTTGDLYGHLDVEDARDDLALLEAATSTK